MAVAYATLGKEFLALILKVVMVRTVVTPGEREEKQVPLSDIYSISDEITNFLLERRSYTPLKQHLSSENQRMSKWGGSTPPKFSQ